MVPSGGLRLEIGRLREQMAIHLPDYMVPATYVLMDAFPLTPNGKVDRRALPAPEVNAPEGARTVKPPRNPKEQTLVEIWKQVLGRESIGIEDDIFDLGADSILIFQIAARATKDGLPLTPALLFRHRNIAALASAISPAIGTPTTAAPSTAAIARVNRADFKKKAGS